MKTKEECPGEFVCTTDNERGICARQGLSIETKCKADRCHLFFTKRGSTPLQYEAPLEAAIRLLERKLSDFENNEEELPLYEVRAKIEFDRASRIVENEREEEREAKRDEKDKQGQPGRGFNKGDSTAFAWTDEQLKEMYEARERRERKKRDRKRDRKIQEESF